MPTPPHQYADDAPITSPDEDRFSRAPFAERIAHVFATRRDSASLVVGIYGPWGDGKSSVLNLMARVLRAQATVLCIAFNPWHFATERRLIRGYFDTLADALVKALPDGAEIAALLDRYAAIQLLGTGEETRGEPAGPDVTAAGDGGRLSNVALDELKAQINARLLGSGRKIVVLIDDIDRLDAREIHAILKLIKLSASFEHTDFVLAFDDEVVSASLGERYAATGRQAGGHFLEKIIQVPLNLPDAESADLLAACFNGVDDVLAENGTRLDDVETFVRQFSDGVMPALSTPRQAKRFVNAIRFAVPLLGGEVHTADLLLVEGLRTAYPRVYLSVRDNRDIYTGERLSSVDGDAALARQAVRDTVEQALKELTGVEREGALNLLKALFPRLHGVYGNTTYGADWTRPWSQGRRIASDDYFRRYFQYSVPARDVADAQVAAAVEACNANRPADVAAFFADVARREAWARCFEELFNRAQQLTATGANTLALAVTGISASIPRPTGLVSSTRSPARLAARLTASLIGRLGGDAVKAAAAAGVIDAAPSLAFAAECLRGLSTADAERGDPAILSADQIQVVGARLAERIKRALSLEPGFAVYARTLELLLRTWKTYGAAGDMQAFLSRRFTDNPGDATSFLSAFAADGPAAGVPRRDFDRREYDAVIALVPPAVVLAALKTAFADLSERMTFDAAYAREGPAALAARFIAIDTLVARERAAARGGAA